MLRRREQSIRAMREAKNAAKRRRAEVENDAHDEHAFPSPQQGLIFVRSASQLGGAPRPNTNVLQLRPALSQLLGSPSSIGSHGHQVLIQGTSLY